MADPGRVDAATSEWAQARSPQVRYGFAVVVAALGLVLDVLVDQVVAEQPLYALLVAAVALSAGYGGLGPGVVTAVLEWSLAIWLLVEPKGELAVEDSADLTRWAVALAIALGLIVLMESVRRGRARAVSAVLEAEEAIRDVTALQELAAACSAAVTQADVAHALIQHIPLVLGARGGAVGLIDGDELVVVDPNLGAGLTHRPGTRIPLTTRAPIAQASATGRTILVRDRPTFERDYPDGIALTDYARAAVAVPLRIAGEVVGSMSFLFDREEALAPDAQAVAGLAADLGGQAFERARLYDREHESRAALDRILRMSPSFLMGTEDVVTDVICREARMTFGADLGMLWRLGGGTLELVCSDPPRPALPPGLVASLDDFPALLDTVGDLQVSFVSDILEEARGIGLERVQELGLRSSLRMPVAVAGETEHLVIVSWETSVSEPDPSTFVLARRFADQAGLALEQVERRRAESEAARRADETRRLQRVTAALALASSATDVADVCLEHALAAVGAEAGFVVLSRSGAAALELVSSQGYAEPELELWRGLDLVDDVPASRAFASGEPVWALLAEEMAAFTGVTPTTDVGWATLPLTTGRGVRGALHLSFKHPRELTGEERAWLQAVVGQCAQALERSLLFDEEQRLRERADRLQQTTSALANALSRADVADTVARELQDALDADAAGLLIVVPDRSVLRFLAWPGYADGFVEPRLEVPLGDDRPLADAVGRRTPTFYASFGELERRFPGITRDAAAGHESLLLVPLVAERQVTGLLVSSWRDPYVLTDDARSYVASLAGLAGQALLRASHFETEQTIAATLQRSVLPAALPRLEGVQLAARYVPGTAELNVGGDWFDAITLSDGKLGVVVGDVVGKGVQAAATMAQLRNALRAFSLDRMKPSSTITRLNRLAEEVLDTAFATVVYAVIDPRALVCRYTSAGHPPPLAAFPDGRVELLEGGRGLPLGTGPAARYAQDVVELPSGSVLLLYTDGLVERRGESIDAGLADLRQAALDGPRDPDQLVEHVLERLLGPGERDDDVALLAVRVFAVAPRPLELRVSNDVGSLETVREALRVWLEGAPAGRAESEEIVLAAWEACANAIEHARDPGRDVVSVRAGLDDSRVRVVVQDSGRWTPPADRPDRGLGLRLIRSLMSSVDVDAGHDGTRVTFEKALTGAGEPGPAPRTAKRGAG